MKRNILLLCETRHVLLNYLILTTTELKDDNVDIVLTDTTNWGSIQEKLKSLKIFRAIYCLPLKELNLGVSSWSSDEDSYYRSHLNKLFPGYPRRSYDDVWFNLPSYSSLLLWGYLLKYGKNEPTIHYIDEGTASYTLKPFENPLNLDTWPIRQRYIANIKDIWLLNASFWSGSGRIPLKIEQLNTDVIFDKSFIRVLETIFVLSPPPRTKYVFFEECYIRNRHTVNDLEVLESIASIVGKENITVRLHPKTTMDRFTPHGFNVAKNDGSLWELTCLLSNLADNIFLTVKSSAVFSALSMSHFPPKIILFKDIVQGCFPNKSANDFEDYIKTVGRAVGQDSAKLFVPQTREELDIILNEMQRG